MERIAISQDQESTAHSPAQSLIARPRKSQYDRYAVTGQVTVVPATQTTVVTTTTTTTLTLPPFFCKQPKSLRLRDPEKYPLAATPTPPHLKRVQLDLGEHTTYLEEVEDTEDIGDHYENNQRRIHDAGGTLQSSSSSLSTPESRPGPKTFKRPSVACTLHSTPARRSNAKPVSTPDAQELHSFHQLNHFHAHPLRQQFCSSEESSQESPDSEADDEASIRTPLEYASGKFQQLQQTRRSESVGGLQSPAEISEDHGSDGLRSSASSFAESDVDPFASSIRQSDGFRRAHVPPTIDTASANDVSLPSPSLSPITASRTRACPAFGTSSGDSDSSVTRGTQGTAFESAVEENIPHEVSTPVSSPTTVSDIFGIIEKFDDLPEQVKNYCLHGILKRCTKANLHFVAQTIDPALRCDFLGQLPPEISLQVLDHLDARSLCQAAQVSRKWRSLVDTDEKVWCKLLEEDGYRLADDEVERAIRGGWGWYSNSYPAEALAFQRRSSRTPKYRVRPSTADSSTRKRRSSFATSQSKRQKIKRDTDSQDEHESLLESVDLADVRLKTELMPSFKRTHRRGTAMQNEADWITQLGRTNGPSAVAKLAFSVPPKLKRGSGGLSSLRHLHLYKSLYRRHHEIRQSWMDPAAKPQHLAFRAHERHVVTCLQFDNDVILTGSDDSNIDIYDTKTGSSVSRLQGHDGGVWALEYQGDLLVSGSTDRSVRVWDMKKGVGLHVFQGHTSTVRCLQILKPTKIGMNADGSPIMMPKEPLIITGSRDATCRIWRLPNIGDAPIRQESGMINDAENPYFVRVLSGHTNSVRAIAAHGDTLVSGSYDATVRVWTVSSGELVHRLQGHTTKVYSVVLDHKRKRCISGSMDNNVRIWSLDSGASLYSLEGHTSLVGLLDLRDDVLVSAAADATLRIWDPSNGTCRHTLAQHTGAITCFAHDGQKIISGSDRTLKMWNTQTGECVRDLLTDLNGVWQIKFDARRCVAAVQRNNWTYIEVMDFGAARDGVPESGRGHRVVVNGQGQPMQDAVEADNIALQA